ncbi:aminomethyltransferase, mitochondrial-like [Rhopilema esculentum]|uniref:aminomethyltransferase, mitochondrial-like n=1 Tax=Rhopilema esculentum TaxID=499914 RepID=UPI0031D1A38C|eukprot:gene2094-17666_t
MQRQTRLLLNGCVSKSIKSLRWRRSLTEQAELQKTSLYDFHLEHGGKMVPFAGYSMPVQYKLGIVQSHLHTREKASLFDVSHMLQFKIFGRDRIKCFEQLVVADVEGLSDNTGGLSLFTNENGGIRDDCIINRLEDCLYIVSNAGCAEKIRPLVENHVNNAKKDMDVAIEFLDDKSLLALQGPEAAKVLQNGVSADLSSLKFMNSFTSDIFSIPGCRITRCGYTGEDGFEISVSSDKAVALAEAFLDSGKEVVELAGLGARDSLRLEAGLCLYGNDIDEETTPVEATLVWTIGKRRRTLKDFPGAKIILDQIKAKPKMKRVGLLSSGPPARGGTKVFNEEGKEIGYVTSGCPSPSLKKNVAMAYVPLGQSKIGTKMILKVYKKEIPTEVVKMPFLAANYYH